MLFRSTIQDNYFQSEQHVGPVDSYGIWFGNVVSDVLATNNIIDKRWIAAIFSIGASGNVYSYNYHVNMQDSHDLFFHGTHPNTNLIEGNDVYRITMDNWWGRQGPKNYVFRNRARGEIRTEFQSRWNDAPVFAERNYFVGNSANWFLQYPYCTYPQGCFDFDGHTQNMWVEKNLFRIGFIESTPEPTSVFIDNVHADQAPDNWNPIPASFYLTEPPEFWGDKPWPAIGSDVDDYSGTLVKLPAQDRYEQVGNQECSNGVLDNGEVCDDENANDGDGCSSACQIETGYGCMGTPSTCGKLPHITQQSTDRVVDRGSSVAFYVTATDATSYQWKKDGNDISNATNRSE